MQPILDEGAKKNQKQVGDSPGGSRAGTVSEGEIFPPLNGGHTGVGGTIGKVGGQEADGTGKDEEKRSPQGSVAGRRHEDGLIMHDSPV